MGLRNNLRNNQTNFKSNPQNRDSSCTFRILLPQAERHYERVKRYKNSNFSQLWVIFAIKFVQAELFLETGIIIITL